MTTISRAEPVQEIDPAAAEAFAGNVLGIINGGALSLMLSIGHRTGLFDTMANRGPAAVAEIAGAAGLNERYVREWLAAVVTGGVVEYDPAAQTYRLPPEHAASLTRAAGPGNLTTIARVIGMLGAVEDDIVQCFEQGGGVPYERFGTFHEIMAQDSAQLFDAALLDAVVPLVPGLAARLEAGIDVCDVGCGMGHAINLLARAYPASRFTGWDISPSAIEGAMAEARTMGLQNATFEVRDAATIDEQEAFDLVTTFDAVHDQAHPRRALRAIRESLRPGGVYLCVELNASSRLEENLDMPLAPFLYATSTMHCMTVSLAAGGEGLGAGWGRQQARELLHEAGFSTVEERYVEDDIANVYIIARP